MPTFTVSTVMKTGKSSPKYGTEYYVKFAESDDTFSLWFKKAPEEGQEIDGDIKDGKFTKIKKEWKETPDGGAVNPTEKKWTPVKRDNSDGMRQGMCMNNASNYVNSLEFPKALTDREWAQLVYDYACALYVLGDLQAKENIDAENVAAVFGGK